MFSIYGRPAVIVKKYKRKARNPKWGWVQMLSIRHVDGKHPATREVTAGEFRKAKVLKPSESAYWERVDRLIQLGMDSGRAKAQASAESAKGILV